MLSGMQSTPANVHANQSRNSVNNSATIDFDSSRAIISRLWNSFPSFNDQCYAQVDDQCFTPRMRSRALFELSQDLVIAPVMITQ